jgi:phospholipid/cholesterol/gamma-HCH transport system substrate-binding protein
MRGKKELIVGAFVLSAIVLLLIGISYLRQQSVLARSEIYHVILTNVEGLTEGDKVLVNGYPVGKVTELKFNPRNGQIAVFFDVNNEIAVPKDTKATLASFDFFGSKCLRLQIGKSQELAHSGDLLIGNVETGMIEEVKNEMLPVKDKIEKVVEDIQVLTSSLKKQFQDSTSHFNNILKNVDATTGNVAVLSQDFRGTVHKINHLTDSLNGMVNMLKSYDPQVKKIMTNAGDFTASMNASTSDLKQLIQNTKSSTDELKILMTKINSGQGTMGQLMNDPKLYNNLTSATKSLDSLLVDLRQHPKRYVQFSLIGRKEKK